MSSPSVELQTAIFELLTAPGSATAAIVGGGVYDNVPEDAAFPYVSFGPSYHYTDDADEIRGRVETFQIDGWTDEMGKLRGARILADALTADLHEAAPELPTHGLVSLRVTLCRVMLDQDNITGHAVVQVEAMIDEAA